MTNLIKGQFDKAIAKTIEVDFGRFIGKENYSDTVNKFMVWVNAATAELTEKNVNLFKLTDVKSFLAIYQFELGGANKFGQQSKIYHSMILKNLS